MRIEAWVSCVHDPNVMLYPFAVSVAGCCWKGYGLDGSCSSLLELSYFLSSSRMMLGSSRWDEDCSILRLNDATERSKAPRTIDPITRGE